MSHEGRFAVAINGTPYQAVQEQYGRRFLDVVRQQADNGQEPSEFSLNPNDLWRRAQTDWSLGAGQAIFDARGSSRNRFRDSGGVDPFTVEGDLTLARGVDRVDTNATGETLTKMVTTSSAAYVLMTELPQQVRIFAGTQTDSSAVGFNINDMCAVGSRLFVATTDGIYHNDPEWTKVNSLVAEKIAYVRGRLLASSGADLHNITDLGSMTSGATEFAGLVDDAFEWTAFGDTESVILAAGIGGEQSYLYQITLDPDTGTLDPPVVVAQLPDGERVRSIKSYLGVTTLATSSGVRTGVMNGASFVFGPLLYKGSDVWDLEPDDKYVYFTVLGGLGRLNLANFLPDQSLAPAYALDVVTGTANAVYSVASKPTGMTVGTESPYTIIFLQDTNGQTNEGGVFEVSRSKYTTELADYSTGRITYSMADKKTFLFLEVKADFVGAEDFVQVLRINEAGEEGLIGIMTGPDLATGTFLLNEQGDFIELKFRLKSGDTVNGTTTPTLKRWTLRSMPIPRRTEQVVVPIDLRRSIVGAHGGVEFMDVWAEYQKFQGFVRSGETVTYEEFGQAYTATVENVQLGPDLDVDMHDGMWEGVCQLTLRIYNEGGLFTPEEQTYATNDMFGVGTFGEGTFGDRD